MHSTAATCVLLLTMASAAFGQTDDFNDGNDAGWTRFNPIGTGSYSLPAGGYRIATAASPNAAAFGPGRSGALRQEVVYGRFHLSVDIVGWDGAQDASLGLLARVQPNPQAGALSCYAVTFNTQDSDFGIERVTGEQPTNLGGYARFTAVAGRPYRLVFAGIGSRLEAHLYDLTAPAVPVASRVVEDSTWATGTCGLVVFSDSNEAVAGTFDNFSAAESAPVPTDDFNDGNDAGWTRVNPVGVGTYSFPGGALRIAAAATPDPVNMGPARAGNLRTGQVLTDFCVAVDVMDFSAAEDAAVGLLARVTNPGPGTLNGYSLTYQTQDNDLEINRITGEAPQKISAGSVSAALDPMRRYRMVFAGRGSRIQGRVYDLQSGGPPVAVVTADDSTWASGLAGPIVFSDSNTAAGATFDTWHAGAVAPPPLGITKDAGGNALLWWQEAAAACHRLETSTDLSNWSVVTDLPAFAADMASLQVAGSGNRFYRLAFGTP